MRVTGCMLTAVQNAKASKNLSKNNSPIKIYIKPIA